MFSNLLERIALTATERKPSIRTLRRTPGGGARPLGAIILAIIAAIVAPSSAADGPGCFEKRLPNGVHLVVYADPSLPLACVDVWVRAGSVFEKPGEEGAAHFLEHMLFKGTPANPRGRLDERIENLGATLNASTSRDWAHFHTTVAPQHLRVAIDLLADALQNPLFEEEEMERERRVILSEIAGRRSDPTQFLDDEIGPRLYGSHPYGRPVYASAEAVSRIGPPALRAFHNRNYVGAAITVIVVGGVQPQQTLSALERAFASVPEGAAPEWPEKPSPPEKPVVVDLPRAPDGSEWMSVGFLGPGIDAPADVWAMDVLISVLVRQSAGRLHDALVTQNKTAKAIDVSFLTQKLPARVTFTLVSEPGKTEENRAEILRQLDVVGREGVTEAELEAAKRYLLGTYAFEVETAAGQAGSLGFYAVLSSIRDSLDYASHISAVTREDVRRVAAKYLRPDRSVTVRMSQ
ncbi:MAG: peptidase M16 [Armatimonadota bacterium]|nr:MAG: peptidase M16 [Armatimonadota bacterium]